MHDSVQIKGDYQVKESEFWAARGQGQLSEREESRAACRGEPSVVRVMKGGRTSQQDEVAWRETSKYMLLLEWCLCDLIRLYQTLPLRDSTTAVRGMAQQVKSSPAISENLSSSTSGRRKRAQKVWLLIFILILCVTYTLVYKTNGASIENVWPPWRAHPQIGHCSTALQLGGR